VAGWPSPAAGSGVEAGVALTLLPVRMFAAAFAGTVRMQQQMWANVTGLARRTHDRV
jgi:hypothetical protein